MKKTMLLLPMLLIGCTSLKIEYSQINEIQITLDSQGAFADKFIHIPVHQTKQKLVDILNKSKDIDNLQRLKERLIEGQYSIQITYSNGFKDTFEVLNPLQFIDHSTNRLYYNPDLANYCRELFIYEIRERGTRFD